MSKKEMISKSALPGQSILSGGTWDYTDSFQGIFTDKKGKVRSADIGKLFFSSGPKWIVFLFAIRNRIVGLIGLKTSGNVTDRQATLDHFKCEKGE